LWLLLLLTIAVDCFNLDVGAGGGGMGAVAAVAAGSVDDDVGGSRCCLSFPLDEEGT
jgi:hypothetical protein